MSRLTDSALARYRQHAGLSATAAAVGLGVHVSMVSKWESGLIPPRPDRLEAMVLLYNASLGQLQEAIRKDGLRYLAKLSKQRRSKAAS